MKWIASKATNYPLFEAAFALDWILGSRKPKMINNQPKFQNLNSF